MVLLHMLPLLLPNTEFTKHDVQDVFCVYAACDLGDCLGGIA